MATKDYPTQEQLKQLFNYDPDTGIFTFKLKTARCVKVGKIAGSLENDGYLRIAISGERYHAHRMAFIYMNCELSNTYQVDHINGIRIDNRISNLRLATIAENSQNQRNPSSRTKTGFLGVSWKEHAKKFLARIVLDGKYIHIGYFVTAEEAHEAYLKAKRELHPFCTI